MKTADVYPGMVLVNGEPLKHTYTIDEQVDGFFAVARRAGIARSAELERQIRDELCVAHQDDAERI
jgi:hypothetical protein